MGKIVPLSKSADSNHKLIPYHIPIISPFNFNWQMDKCSKLGIIYRQAIKQPSALAGSKLSDYLPWQYENIEKDGNCLFRCIFKLISGSQEYHAKIRGEICRFIGKDGREVLNWYFHAISETPLSYLKRTMMQQNAVWGIEVEIFAVSAILETEIYVAVECEDTNKVSISSYDFHEKIIRWYRYSASNNYDKSFAIYIANLKNHYEPVITLINSGSPTYAENSQKVISIIL